MVVVTEVRAKVVYCQYASGRDDLGAFNVVTLSNAATARAEFRAEVRASSVGRPKPTYLSGPWNGAYSLSNTEMYVLKGRHILHLQFKVPTTTQALSRLAKKAVKKL